MKNRLIKKLRIFSWLLMAAGSCMVPGEELSEIRQITTHPQMDFQPAVSPDGKWLAFTSSRSGNLDIWIRPLPRGKAVQVTYDRSEDVQPAWMPDSRSLVFMSKRRDAMGDLWRIRIRKTGTVRGKPEQLTTHLGWDQSPSVSPDGRYVAYISDMNGGLNVHIMDLKTGAKRALTTQSAAEPSWSPDGRWLVFTSFPASAYGDLTLAFMPPFFQNTRPEFTILTSEKVLDGQAKWSPDGRWIIFQRIQEDSNGDGLLTPEDHGSLWEKAVPDTIDRVLYKKPSVQLTSDLYHDASPAWHDTLIYFMSDRGQGEDIWVMPEHGMIPYESSVDAQYMDVYYRFGMVVTPPALHQALLGYRRVLTLFPDDSAWCARSWIRMGELELMLGRHARARTAFETVRREYGSWSRETAEAIVKEASIPSDDIDGRIALCESVLNFENQPGAVSEAYLLLGDLYNQQGDPGKSISAYSAAIASGTRYQSLTAQARLKIGDLFQEQGQAETARQHYLAVLREYGGTPLWRQRSIERIMSQVSGSTRERIAACQDIQLQASDLPALMAEAQLVIAQILMDQSQWAQALRELEQVPVLVPGLRWSHGKALLMQADIADRQNDFLKARQLLYSVIDEYDDVEAGLYRRKAEAQLFELSLRSAETSKALRDYPLAVSRYRTAMDLEPEDIRVHRGLVESSYYWQRQRDNGKLDSLIHDYQNILQRDPDRPVILYSLGLAFSYRGEREISMLNKSNEYLLAALESDYRFIQPYRTLGYNFELMERLTELEQAQKPGLIRKTGKVILTPFRWVKNVFDRSGESGPSQYYEKAIDVLTTAIELNDEKQDPRLEAEIAQNLANNFYNLGEYGFARAFRYYQKRLELDTVFYQPLEKAVFYSRAGHAAFALDEHEISEIYLKKSIALYESLGRESLKTAVQGRLAYLYQIRGDYQSAIDLYETITERAVRLRQWDAVIRGYRNIAYNYHMLWEPEDAIRYARKAEKVLADQNIPKGPPEKSYLRWEFFGLSIPIWGMEEIGASSSEGFTLAEEAALIYILIGKNAERLKDFATAIDVEEKRIRIFEDRKDKLAQRISYNRLGLLFMKQARYEDAWVRFQKAFEMSRKAEDERGKRINLLNMGQIVLVQMSQEQNSVYLADIRQMLDREKKRLEQENDSGPDLAAYLSLSGMLKLYEANLSQTQDSFDGILHRLQILADADQVLADAARLCAVNGLWREQAITLKSRAEAAVSAGDLENAVHLLMQAETLFEKHGENLYLWRVRYALARTCSQLGASVRDSLNMADPLRYYASAMDLLEALPVSEENSELRLADREDRWHLYTDAAAAYAGEGRNSEALAVIERGRQKRVADVLARRPPGLRRERHKNLWRNISDVRAQLSEVRQRLLAEEALDKKSPRMLRLRDREKLLNDEYRAFMTDMQEEDPVLAYLSGAAPVQMSRIRACLSSQGVLSYVTDRDRLTIYAMDKDSVRMRTVPVPLDSLAETVRLLSVAGLPQDSVRTVVDRLSSWLVSPVSGWLENQTRLVVVPDDVIWNVPFERLKTAGDQLLELMTISYAPSLTAYQLAFERKRINQSSLLIVGDTWDASLSQNLPQECTVLAGNGATETALKQAGASADLIHVERWMLPNEASPLQASLILFASDEDDGYVRPEELFSWDIASSLVKLPAARTGNFYHSLELYTYALLYAGTPTVIFSRTPQTEEIRRDFAQSFYDRCVTSAYDEALNMTQILLRDRHRGPEWASYGLMGFEGLNRQARLAFARENLVSTVLAGRNYVRMGEYADAIGLYEQALDMAESLNDSTSRRGIMMEIIRSGMQGEIWDKAIVYQQRLMKADTLADRTGDLEVARQNLVTFYYRNGQFDKAAETKIRALVGLREQGRLQEVAQGAMELAVIFSSARNYDAAITWAEEAYMTYMSLDQNPGKARALIWKGRALLDSERFFEARAAFSLAIELLDKSEENGSGSDAFEMATAYQLRGICHENLSLYQDALRDQAQALEILGKLDRPLQTGQGHQYLANVYWKTGNYRQALDHESLALAEFEKQKQGKYLAMAYSTEGLIHMSLGDMAKAKQSEEKALELAVSIQSREDEATILKNIGQIAIQEGDLQKAYAYFQQATAIDSTLDLRRGLSYDYRNQGMLLIQMRRFTQAVSKLEQGLELAESVRDPRNMAHCHYGLSLARLRMGHFSEALAAADTGLGLTERITVPELTWRLFRQRGQIHWALKQREEAFGDFGEAVEIVEKIRAELKVEAFKQGFFDSKMDLYHDTVRLLLEMRDRNRAFQYVERAKSRDFIDMLANQEFQVPAGQRRVLETEQRLKIQIQEVQNHAARLHGQPRFADEFHAWQDSLVRLRGEYEAFMTRVQSGNPELASMISVDPWTVDMLQRHLPQGTAVVEYFWGTETGYVWAVTGESVGMAMINVSQEALAQTVMSMRSNLVAHLSVDESRVLYDWLIAPVSSFLDSISHVVFVPHGILHYLPFSALEGGNGFLIDRFSISLAPSGTVLGYCLEKGRPWPQASAELPVLAFGNPDLGDERMDLAYAEKEILSLEREFTDVTAFFGKNATEAAVGLNAGSERLLHFACHAVYEAENPLFSALLLTPTPEEDGRLEAQEIFGMHLDCDLVTLSACETGLGKITQGDEIIGLSRSFIYAGTPSVLTSLWKVDDLATAVMMKRFYRSLAEGNGRAEALRRAQIIVRDRVNPHPSAWAAFHITGDFR
ncbi:CHAT domain-containing protein [bacterium]|nr:CHAT domain-containing protein [bacterium]